MLVLVTKEISTRMYTWNAKDYADNSRGQEAWARELLTLVDLRPDDVVLDIGCGDGRTTAAIAQSVPHGRVVGVDLSADMVAHATTQHCSSLTNSAPPNSEATNKLRFAQADAAALAFTAEFSVVFSNATLHWVPDQHAAVRGIARALRPGGRFIAQFGGKGNVADMARAFEQVMASPRWRDVVKMGELPYRFHDASTYEGWLREAGFAVKECRLIPKNMPHENLSAFIGWLRTAWHPFTAGVPLELRDAFLEEVAGTYLAAFPLDSQGRVHIGAVRLQIQASKA